MSAQQVNKIFSLILLMFGRYCAIVFKIIYNRSKILNKREKVKDLEPWIG